MKKFLRVLFADEQVVVMFLGMIVGLVIGALALTILNLDGNVTAGTAVAVMGLSIGGGAFVALSLKMAYIYAHSDLP